MLCLGEFVDEAPAVSSYRGTRVYYKSTRELTEDWLTTADYCFRYDTEAHWLTRTVPPLEWAPVDTCHWRVELRCPECEWTSAGLYEQSALDRFDQILDDGTDSLLEDYRRLQRSNMEAEIERFSVALSTDLVMPEDF